MYFYRFCIKIYKCLELLRAECLRPLGYHSDYYFSIYHLRQIYHRIFDKPPTHSSNFRILWKIYILENIVLGSLNLSEFPQPEYTTARINWIQQAIPQERPFGDTNTFIIFTLHILHFVYPEQIDMEETGDRKNSIKNIFNIGKILLFTRFESCIMNHLILNHYMQQFMQMQNYDTININNWVFLLHIVTQLSFIALIIYSAL